MTRSPLAPAAFPAIPGIAGVRLAVARAGYKAWERADLTLAEFAPGTSVAGLTTRSRCPSPEVELCRAHLTHGRARALVVNAGNSNAFTGARGAEATRFVTATTAAALACPETEVFVASTGVIGVPLPMDKARAGARRRLCQTARRQHGELGTCRRRDRHDRHLPQGRLRHVRD